MSNGSQLLLQLREQQRHRHRKVAEGTSSTTTNDNANADGNTYNPTSSPSSSVCITVCTGIHCGAVQKTSTSTASCSSPSFGTSATLIEIEELLQENQHPCRNNEAIAKVHVKSGDCTDRCTVGPNVFVQSHHFPRVDSTAACWEVTRRALALSQPQSRSQSSLHGEQQSTMTIWDRRAEGLRWRALREMVREEVADSLTSTLTCDDSDKDARDAPKRDASASVTRMENLLVAARDAELVAAGSNMERKDQALRRFQRLVERLHSLSLS